MRSKMNLICWVSRGTSVVQAGGWYVIGCRGALEALLGVSQTINASSGEWLVLSDGVFTVIFEMYK